MSDEGHEKFVFAGLCMGLHSSGLYPAGRTHANSSRRLCAENASDAVNASTDGFESLVQGTGSGRSSLLAPAKVSIAKAQ